MRRIRRASYALPSASSSWGTAGAAGVVMGRCYPFRTVGSARDTCQHDEGTRCGGTRTKPVHLFAHMLLSGSYMPSHFVRIHNTTHRPSPSSSFRTCRAAGLAAAALAVAWLLPGEAGAQETEGFPRAPSIALAAGGGSTVGVWFPMGDRLQVGAEIGLGWNRRGGTEGGADPSSAWSGAVNLTVKVPLEGAEGAEGNLVPYFVAGPQMNVAGGEGRTDVTLLGAMAGFGLDWFPAPRVSVGGHVGARVTRRRVEHRGLDHFGNPTTLSDRTDWSLATLSSGIRVHLYLR
jgi:hypothetical protein